MKQKVHPTLIGFMVFTLSTPWTKRVTLLLSIAATGFMVSACDSFNQEKRPTAPPSSQRSAPPNSDTLSALPTVPTTPISDIPIVTTNQKATNLKTLAFGTFVSGEHLTQGSVNIIDDDGTPIIQFGDDFQTNTGPDLFVVLHIDEDVLSTTAPPSYPLKKSEYVAIAPLKTVEGSQSYSLPAAIIWDKYKSVAIWCRQFNATFGTASIQPAT